MDIAKTYREFAWKLACAQLDNRQNDCTAPFGLWTLLTAIYAGAEGMAEAELSQLLFSGVNGTVSDLLHDTEALSKAVSAQDAIRQNSTEIQTVEIDQLLPEYLTMLRSAFGNTLKICDGGTSKALLLTSEMRFYEEWQQKFKETHRPFFMPTYAKNPTYIHYTPQEIPFLYQTNQVGYRQQAEAISVTLPFKSKKKQQNPMPHASSLFSMISALSEMGSASAFKMVLTMPLHKTVWEYMRGQERLPHELYPYTGNTLCDLYIPAFEIENKQKDLIPVLRSLGLDNVFEEHGSELTKITQDPLYISSVQQDAQIEVNATGASARALTSIMINATVGIADDPVPETVCFDHPFLFSLWLTEPVQIPLFIGVFHGK